MTKRYNINYRTFDTFMYDVADDLASLDDQGYINSDKYIKVVQKVNADLSVKINPIKETVVKVVGGRAILPDDFKLLTKAFICYQYEVKKNLMGTTIEYSETEVEPLCDSVESLCRNEDYTCTPYQVWRKNTDEIVNIYGTLKIKLINSSYCSSSCDPGERELDEMYITREKDCYYLHTSFDEGEVYIEYVSEMIDDEGNLLILDHPLTIEYYEYAVKVRIYEDLWLNGVEQVANKLKYVKEELRMAKWKALSFVNAIDFAELKQVYYANRRKIAGRYFHRIM